MLIRFPLKFVHRLGFSARLLGGLTLLVPRAVTQCFYHSAMDGSGLAAIAKEQEAREGGVLPAALPPRGESGKEGGILMHLAIAPNLGQWSQCKQYSKDTNMGCTSLGCIHQHPINSYLHELN